MTSKSFAISKRWRKTLAGFAGVAVVILVFGLHPLGRIFVQRTDRLIGDWIISCSGGPPERKDLVLLGIDDVSLQLDGLDPAEIAGNPTLSLMKQRFPWNRRVWAAAIDRLADAGAKLIVLDLIFSETSDPEADEELAAAIKRHPDQVVLASVISPGGAGAGDVFMVMEPDEQFIDAGPHIGYVNFYRDQVDGLVRMARYSTTLGIENTGKPRIGEPEYRSLAAEVIHAMGAVVPSGDHQLRFAQNSKYGASEVYAPGSVYGIFADKEWKNNYDSGRFFRDKVVMIGPVAPRLQDIHNTPVGSITGPQLHLQAIACGLDKAFIRRSNEPWYGMILLSLVALVWIRLISRPLLSVFGLMGIIACLAGIVLWVGVRYSLILAVSGGLLALVIGWAVALSYEMVTERLEKRRLRKDFRRFVSRDVADAMIENPELWRESAAGVKRRVVVLFSDVRGFTTRSELSDPADLVRQLNEYLTIMVEVVFRNGGTLDKFIGDAVMAHWGALGGGSCEVDARKAIVAAREMLDSLERLNFKWKNEGKPGFQIGIGLHLGEVLAGEIGSPDRTEFGIIGDVVNLASRLEGLTKTFGSDVIFSEDVKNAAGIEEGIIDLGQVQVKGRQTPGRLYAIGNEVSVKTAMASLVRNSDSVIVIDKK